MKIWIFNILVAGALAYLFLGESEQTRVKSDLDWASGKVEASLDSDTAGVREKAPPPAAPAKIKSAERPAPASSPEPQATAAPEPPVQIAKAPPAKAVETDPPHVERNPVTTVAAPPPEAPRVAMIVESASGGTQIDRVETVSTGGALPGEIVVEDLPPLDDPEVARRRAIVLDIEQAAPPGDSPAPREASEAKQASAMAARERRDALNALAEDMELLFADKMTR